MLTLAANLSAEIIAWLKSTPSLDIICTTASSLNIFTTFQKIKKHPVTGVRRFLPDKIK